MKFTGHFTGAKLDLSAFQRRLEAHLKSELQRVTKTWLHAVTGRVPVWSGMARGSLLNVAEEVGSHIDIMPVVKSRTHLGQPMGMVKSIYGPTNFTIEISSRVPHYVLQEYENVDVSKSAPWRSFAAGASMYRTAVQTVTLPFPVFKPVKIKI